MKNRSSCSSARTKRRNSAHSLVIKSAKKMKHYAFRGWKTTRRLMLSAADGVTARATPYRFVSSRYPEQRYLRHDAANALPGQATERIFALWTGSNAMPPARNASLEDLREKSDVEVILVTRDTISDWVLPEFPLHPAWHHLSLTHKSDYLRAYLMHHHGGGYSDIKRTTDSWAPTFRELNSSNSVWVIGYAEVSRGVIPNIGGNLGTDLKRHWRLLLGTGAMIAKPKSPFTAEWLAEVERRLDYFSPLLMEHPGGVRDEVQEYPVGWTQILADVYYALTLKHQHHVKRSRSLLPILRDYR